MKKYFLVLQNKQTEKGGQRMEILLLGNSNCTRCDMVKNILTEKNLGFKYELLEDLPSEVKAKYIAMAREKKMMQMPIIIKDDTVVTLQDLI
jgi:glutaredoxin